MDGSVILERQRCPALTPSTGPVGPFFGASSALLAENGREVTKVHLNGGDAWFYDLPGPLISTSLSRPLAPLRRQMLESRRIDGLILWGLQAVSSCRDSEGPATKGAGIRFRGRLHPPGTITFEPAGSMGFRPCLGRLRCSGCCLFQSQIPKSNPIAVFPHGPLCDDLISCRATLQVALSELSPPQSPSRSIPRLGTGSAPG